MSMRSLAVALALFVALLVGFYSGYKFAAAKPVAAATNSGAARTGTGGTGTGGTVFGRGGAAACPTPGASPAAGARGAAVAIATGTITSLTASSITVHNAQCNTDTTVTFGANVTIRKTVAGAVSDLQQNQNVTVTGQAQANGSVRATSITIGAAGPAGGTGGPGGRPSATPSGS